MRSSFVVFLGVALTASATKLFDSNLAYSSPFVGFSEFARDTRAIQKRHIEHIKRSTVGTEGFSDEHYPTFYGADFSNAPFLWNGGVNFTHRVASGDPFDTSVLLWTRAFPINGTPDQSVPVCVSFNVFDNPDLKGKPVDSGEAFTSWDVDFTVKVEATGLKAESSYWYQFADCTNPSSTSVVGATKTLPHPNTPAQQVNGGKPLTFAVFSCSQFQNGYFNAYGVATHNTSAEFFVHLGDYIYESLGNGASIGRKVLGRELATIHDYRQRLGQYRTDVSLLDAHQAHPWITVWVSHNHTFTVYSSPDLSLLQDDHEVADQSWKAGTANSNDTASGCAFSPSGACFTDRKLAGVRAYHEWMPIRQVDVGDKLRIWRNFQFGKLLDLTMLDTRQYDRDITDLYYNTDINSIADFQNRSLMGAQQEKWFYNALSQSKARGAIWRVVGQQIVFTQLDEGGAFDVDAWDGYRANRNRVLDHIQNNKISNTLILSGDSHANWVSDLIHPNDTAHYNPATGDGSLAVEFAGTAVSSGSAFGNHITPQAADVISNVLVTDSLNADLQWSEGSYRGFFTLTLNTTHANATYWAMRNTSTANLDAFPSAEFIVKSGANKLSRPVAGGNVLAGVLKSNAKPVNVTSSAVAPSSSAVSSGSIISVTGTVSASESANTVVSVSESVSFSITGTVTAGLQPSTSG
ncbi:PhoD-like phosphatase-domain-containing protein [Irpex rosettiformis]|uniref:PhoD-like phosphatase-domain-containing protein n=1 Tax=Irpex rosettiformis TaxID=378272 RepID=A0ACB8UGY4_9APHY|nr:PhoD-like phosphatase-domain-containing protein [Irpex rosettiformis]